MRRRPRDHPLTALAEGHDATYKSDLPPYGESRTTSGAAHGSYRDASVGLAWEPAPVSCRTPPLQRRPDFVGGRLNHGVSALVETAHTALLDQPRDGRCGDGRRDADRLGDRRRAAAWRGGKRLEHLGAGWPRGAGVRRCCATLLGFGRAVNGPASRFLGAARLARGAATWERGPGTERAPARASAAAACSRRSSSRTIGRGSRMRASSSGECGRPGRASAALEHRSRRQRSLPGHALPRTAHTPRVSLSSTSSGLDLGSCSSSRGRNAGVGGRRARSPVKAGVV